MAFWKRKVAAKDTAPPADDERKTIVEPEQAYRSREFEEYTAKLFDRQRFTVVILARSRGTTRSSDAGDREPGMRMQFRPTGEEFYVECRYWAQQDPDKKLEWVSEPELKGYFRHSKRHPVFVVVGLGGRPASPAKMFCVPLREARWTELFPNVYTKFERPPSRTFFWKNGDLV